MYGYHGKLLKVDLSNRKIEYQDLSESDCKKFIGGAGIGTKILYEETGPETDPLAPENQLIAMTGPFTGSSVPSTGRHHIVARSPLTGILGESNVGGSWAVHFKRTGFDGIIVSVKAILRLTFGSMTMVSKFVMPNIFGVRIPLMPRIN